jgi:hypothetical protein
MARSPPVKMLGKDFLQAWLDKDGRIHHIAAEKASSPTFVDADMDSHGYVLAVAAGGACKAPKTPLKQADNASHYSTRLCSEAVSDLAGCIRQ